MEAALKATSPDFESTVESVRTIMRGNQRGTRPERAIRSSVHRLGLRFRKDCRPIPGLRCEADIVFSRERIAVFIDGCFWHGCPLHGHVPQRNSAYWQAKIARNQQRDARNAAALVEAGWAVIRAWEHENPVDVAARVEACVMERRHRAAL
jgi:DNA mismatch endonuclease (patch repair protein)